MCNRTLWLLAFFLLLSPSFVRAEGQTKSKAYSPFQKPIFSYLGIEGQALRRLRDWQIKTLETKIRSNIEKGRFIFIKLPLKSVEEGRYVSKMVAIVAAKSLGIAKMRAAWDTQFQGYTVTTEMLNATQNHSFYYWIEATYVKRLYKNGTYSWHMGARLHIRQLHIFPCTAKNRQKGRRYFRACRRKRDTEYGGFAKPFRIVKAFVKGSGLGSTLLDIALRAGGTSRRKDPKQSFINTAQNLGRHFFKKLASIKDFALHSPVMSATFNTVTTNIGKSEGVTVNQGYKIFVRRTNGKYLYRGYARVRNVGDNRMKMVNGERVRVNPKARFLTDAQILSVSNGGSLQKGMLMFEHPMLGVTIGFSVGLAPLAVTIGDGASLGIPFPLPQGGVLGLNLRLNSEFDLSNPTTIPEFYLNVAIDVSFIGSGAFGLLVPILPSVGLIKKFYFRNIGLSLGLRAVVGYLYSSGAGASFMVGGEGLVGLEIFISPAFSMTFRGGFRAAVAVSAPSILSIGPWFMLGGNYSF